MKRLTTTALLLGLVPASAFAAAHATLRPGTNLAVGSPAQLSITVDGDSRPPAAPHVAGASLRLRSQMSQTQIINGQTTQQMTYVYTLVPTQTGPLDIPAITVATSTGEATTEPVHATVTDAAVAQPAAAVAPAADRGSETTHAFITLDLPTKSLVVGQAVPVVIRAYFHGGTSAALQGLPHVTSDAFTLSALSDKPTQTQVEIRGEPYLQASWTATLSPAKPSSGKLGVELPVELAYRSAPRPAQHHSLRDLLGDDPFADDFGADAFGGAGDPFGAMDTMFDIGPMQQIQTTLRGSAGTIVVTDLPTAGRPASFTGGVGRFEVALDPVAGEPRVGEPLTLSIRVSGTGNFDRVAMTGAADSDALKTYAIKSTFVPSAASKLTGTKTFEQTIVPTRAGEVTIPALGLAYFDPAKHAYVTAETKPMTLQVAAPRGGGSSDPGLAATVRDPSMIPNQIEPGGRYATLQPMIRQSRLWVSLAGLVVLTALLCVVAWSRKSPRIAHVLRSRSIDRSVARASVEMQRATRANDRAAFFTAARSALQTRLAATWNTTPEAITAHDVATRLGDRGASIRSVLEQADGVTYGGTTTPESLDHWNHVVRDELANWKAAS